MYNNKNDALTIKQMEAMAEGTNSDEAVAEMTANIAKEVTDEDIFSLSSKLNSDCELSEYEQKVKERYEELCKMMTDNEIVIIQNPTLCENNEEERTITTGLLVKNAITTIKTMEFIEASLDGLVSSGDMVTLEKLAKKKVKVDKKRWRKVKQKPTEVESTEDDAPKSTVPTLKPL